MLPHLVKWHGQYAKKGLVVLDVDNGKIDSLEKLKEHVAQREIPFAVVHDEEAKNCKTYGITGYPSAFVIGVEGKVIWQGFPGAEVGQLPAIIEAELAKVTVPAEGWPDVREGKKETPPKEEPPKEDPPK